MGLLLLNHPRKALEHVTTRDPPMNTGPGAGRRRFGPPSLLALVLAVLPGCGDHEPAYLGSQACASCHEEEWSAWRGSHHDLAMDSATVDNVLGRFDGRTLSYAGVTSRFYVSGGVPMVDTEGPDGETRSYQVGYTFGVFPLQQYLVPFPDGRLQALPLAWDSRPQHQGGQRWFHLYPEDPPAAGDPLHWTGRYQSWNLMCADCHSTDLRRGYDLATDSYRTTWSEIDVACEACHGPGSRHAELAARSDYGAEDTGLTTDLREDATWLADPVSGIPRRSEPPGARRQLESCAPCHSRRTTLRHYAPGDRFLDRFTPSLLAQGLYYPDGQIEDEVYVYGSFLQSRMYRAGVTCSNCHDPHSLSLKASGNPLCTRCHSSADFDTAGHTLHAPGSAGAQCVSCHMPSRTYMVVDDRRDHSFRIPQPGLSEQLGTPNACDQCHADQGPAWAASVIDRSYPPKEPEAEPARVIAAARTGRYQAEHQLASIAANDAWSAILRATTLSLMERYPTEPSYRSLTRQATDPDPLVRLGAIRGLGNMPERQRYLAAAPLLTDTVLAVRAEAAALLAGTPSEAMALSDSLALAQGVRDYRSIQNFNADWPQSHVNLGLLEQRLGDLAAAENAYRTAIRLDRTFVPAWINLAELARASGQDQRVRQLLDSALAAVADSAPVMHSLGLSLVRSGSQQDALAYFAAAARLAPEEPRYGYVQGIALNSLGRADEAQAVLQEVHDRHPDDRESLYALVTILRDRGNSSLALEYARKLAALEFGSRRSTALLEQLSRTTEQ